MQPISSFLVSCCGAYADSGLGTGGLVCVHAGQAVVLDKLDSTGLWPVGDAFYRAVRGLRTIVGYTPDGLKSWLKLPDLRDVHDVVLHEGLWVCASTGQNELRWYDAFGSLRRAWRAAGEGDAWHLNCLWLAGGRLYASAFGEFAEHRGWAAGCEETGFIFDVETGEKVVRGLTGPHNPRYIDGAWVVCNSHAKTLAVQQGGRLRHVPLGGFTRGLAYDDTYFYVGESANRKDPVLKDYSTVAILERATLQVVERVRVPIPEIYEIALLPPQFAANMAAQPERFAFGAADEQLAALEQQVERGYDEIRRLRYSLTQAQNASLRYRFGTFRRKLARALLKR